MPEWSKHRPMTLLISSRTIMVSTGFEPYVVGAAMERRSVLFVVAVCVPQQRRRALETQISDRLHNHQYLNLLQAEQ